MVDKNFTNFAAAEQHRRQALRQHHAVLFETRQGALEKRLCRQRGQRSLFRWLPDDTVAAHQSKGCVPCPHRDRKIECRDDADDSERMPAFHHPMLAALGRDRQAIELTGKPDREVTDVNHLLDLAKAFRHDLANLDRNEPAKSLLVDAQLIAEKPYDLTTLRR